MYVPDTLQRMNEEAVKSYYEKQTECEHCGNESEDLALLEIYNPRDALRDPPITDPYTVQVICQDCLDAGEYMEELFYCDGCGELFVYNHSWDVLAVVGDGGMQCQKCALEGAETITLGELYEQLASGKPGQWLRINRDPSRSLLWEGEFSEHSDFPGHTGFASILEEIGKAAEENELTLDSEVLPLVTHGYQFSVVLAVYF